jgi:hypothetical protein
MRFSAFTFHLPSRHCSITTSVTCVMAMPRQHVVSSVVLQSSSLTGS